MRNRSLRHRVFFALWPDDDALEHLHALAGDLVAHAKVPGRRIPVANLHMTLAFVGAVDETTLQGLLDGADALQLPTSNIVLDRFGFWPRGGVVYAGCAQPLDPGLRQTFAACAGLLDELGLPHDGRAPVPHVTLARNVRGISLPRLGEAVSWRAQEFALVRSELHPSGARYETLASWPMTDADE